MLVLEERMVTIPIVSPTAVGRAVSPGLTRTPANLPPCAIAHKAYLSFCRRCSRYFFPSRRRGRLWGKTKKGDQRERNPRVTGLNSDDYSPIYLLKKRKRRRPRSFIGTAA